MASAYDLYVGGVVDRLEQDGLDPSEYNAIEIARAIMEAGRIPSDLDGTEWLRFVTCNEMEMSTELSCPDWCTRPTGHSFESEDHTGQQYRAHELRLAPEESAYLSITAVDMRAKRDDTTYRHTAPTISFAIDNDLLSASEVRKLAAALLNAADKLDEVTR